MLVDLANSYAARSASPCFRVSHSYSFFGPIFFAFGSVASTVVSYNVESDKGTDPAEVVQDIQQIPASHIWGLVEVDTGEFCRAPSGRTLGMSACGAQLPFAALHG